MPEGQRDLILVLDRAPEVRELLEMTGNRVTAPASVPEDPREVRRLQPDLVILDHFVGTDSPGWRPLRRLRADLATRPIPALVCSGAVTEVRSREGALSALDVGVVRKPFDLDELLGTVRDVLSSRQTDHLVGLVPGTPRINPVRLCQEWGESRGSDFVW